MKKILVTLLVLALCTPAMAATVTITDNANGTGTVTVTAAGAVNIVGLALDVDATAGGNITAATSDTATFNIYPDAAYTQELGAGYVYGTGTPIAAQAAVAGEVAISNSFALSVGALNGDSTAGATGSASVSFTITVDDNTTIEIKENAARGGIVLTDGSGEDITNGTAGVVSGTITVPTDCIAPAAATYADWVSLGKPDCWCYEKQCNGDVDGLSVGSKLKGFAHVETNDLNVLLAAWNVKEPTKGPGILSIPNGVCADFDHVAVGSKLKGFARVETNDLNLLLANWQIKEPTKGPGVPSCPLAPVGDIAFYVAP
ncbi:MAG: hypothetical protein ACYSO7_04890 [Planctomycetota bacterium]|jgi:hypothetical protein